MSLDLDGLREKLTSGAVHAPLDTMWLLLDIAESLRMLTKGVSPCLHTWFAPDDRGRQSCRNCNMVRLITSDVDTSRIRGTNGGHL